MSNNARTLPRSWTGPPAVTAPPSSLVEAIHALEGCGVTVGGDLALAIGGVDLGHVHVASLLAEVSRALGANRPRSSPSGKVAPLWAGPRLGNRPEVPAGDDRWVVKLALSLVALIHGALTGQAASGARSRMLTAEEAERLDSALARLEASIHDLAARHGLDPAELRFEAL